jgi:hypothetical protein
MRKVSVEISLNSIGKVGTTAGFARPPPLQLETYPATQYEIGQNQRRIGEVGLTLAKRTHPES